MMVGNKLFQLTPAYFACGLGREGRYPPDSLVGVAKLDVPLGRFPRPALAALVRCLEYSHGLDLPLILIIEDLAVGGGGGYLRTIFQPRQNVASISLASVRFAPARFAPVRFESIRNA